MTRNATPLDRSEARPARSRVRNRLFQRHILLPGEHGAWVFLLSPLIIGLAAGGRLTIASGLLVLTALAAFLLRQPVTILVKAHSGRRPRAELPSALFWAAIYGATALAGVIALAASGYAFILWLAVPVLPTLGWHLWLVSRRAERRHMDVEIAGSGALALAATAAYWTGRGGYDPLGWLLWGLCWLQVVGSILYAYLRLEQRHLTSWPSLAERLRMGQAAVGYNTATLVLVSVLAGLEIVPGWLPAAFVVQTVEAWWGTLRPAVGLRPTHIGMRQLIVSSLFTVIFALSFV